MNVLLDCFVIGFGALMFAPAIEAATVVLAPVQLVAFTAGIAIFLSLLSLQLTSDAIFYLAEH